MVHGETRGHRSHRLFPSFFRSRDLPATKRTGVMNGAILTPRAAALERIKALVLDTLPSPESKRAYSQALDDFFRWCGAEAIDEFNKATVNAYRASLEARRLSSSTINQPLRHPEAGDGGGRQRIY